MTVTCFGDRTGKPIFRHWSRGTYPVHLEDCNTARVETFIPFGSTRLMSHIIQVVCCTTDPCSARSGCISLVTILPDANRLQHNFLKTRTYRSFAVSAGQDKQRPGLAVAVSLCRKLGLCSPALGWCHLLFLHLLGDKSLFKVHCAYRCVFLFLVSTLYGWISCGRTIEMQIP